MTGLAKHAIVTVADAVRCALCGSQRVWGFMNRLPKYVGALLVALLLLAGETAHAQAFEWVRIGDADGFGFPDTAALGRPIQGVGPGPADTNANGVLEPDEFLPDLNRDGGVWYRGEDNFDNRSDAERKDAGHACQGCLAVGDKTRGSNWTDLSLSPTAPADDWPDLNGPATPNSAAFVFDFTVHDEAIVQGTEMFFNLVFGDYDIDPAVVFVRFKNAQPQVLRIPNQRFRNVDGLIQARTSRLPFNDVFTRDADGNWHGFLTVIFDAPIDPFTAFDYVELSLDAGVSAELDAPDPSLAETVAAKIGRG